MFESKLKKISKEVFNNNNLQRYFILTHKKHNREMYFRVGDKKALDFAKSKFNSFKKRIIFYLLKLGILQIFLKKINLSEEIGQVIFVGEQIKGFNYKEKIANSFVRQKSREKDFLKQKSIQQKLGKEGIAPKVLMINKKDIYSQEELFSSYVGKSENLFNLLFEFYKTNKVKKIKTSHLIKKIKLSFKKNKINETLFNKALNKISKVDYFLQTKIHGEFAKEQCLMNNEKIYFVDWSLREGLITEDLVNYFRLDNNYFNKKEFKKIIKKYPAHVKNNLKEYLLLTELIRISQGIPHFKLSKKRIENLLSIN